MKRTQNVARENDNVSQRPHQSETEREALGRLIVIAKSDTGQSRRTAGFLLAWWNADTCGGFDFTDLWGLDDQIADDITTVLLFIGRSQGYYPDMLGYDADFREIIAQWRPSLGQ